MTVSYTLPFGVADRLFHFLFLLMVTVVLGQGDIYLWSQTSDPLYSTFKMSRLWPCVTLLSLCGDGDRTQGFVPARQALYHLWLVTLALDYRELNLYISHMVVSSASLL